MSESFEEAFHGFVNKLNDQLADIDHKYPEDGQPKADCIKYLEKIDVYKKLTDGLVDNGNTFLKIINHLSTELAKVADTDAASTTSNVSTIQNEKAVQDMDFIRTCLSKRTEIEEQAMNSLFDLEHIVDSLMADKMKLLEENRQLKDRKRKATPDIDDYIATLKKENDELKDTIKRNKEATNAIGKESTKSASNGDKNLADFKMKMEELKRQLFEKDRTIKQLSALVEKYTSASPLPDDSDEPTKESKSIRPKLARSRSDVGQTVDRDGPWGANTPSNLTDCEKSDNDKMEDVFKVLTVILKKKYKQLREYRARNAEMMRRLEQCAATEQELRLSKELVADVNHKNVQLTEELEAIKKEIGSLEALKKEIELCNDQLQNLREREGFLARKFTVQETHIDTLMDERANLMKLNNELLQSVAVCKRELDKYNA